MKWQEFIERYRDNLSPEEREKKWAEKAAMLREDEIPLVAALTAKGWPAAVRQCGDTRSVWDLVNTAEPYPDLLGVLTAHLAQPYHRRTREGIVRALAVREARGTEIQRVLMDELMAETDPNEGPNGYRWALINTLMLIADSSLAADVQKLLADAHFESVRNDLERLAKKLKQPSRLGAKGK